MTKEELLDLPWKYEKYSYAIGHAGRRFITYKRVHDNKLSLEVRETDCGISHEGIFSLLLDGKKFGTQEEAKMLFQELKKKDHAELKDDILLAIKGQHRTKVLRG